MKGILCFGDSITFGRGEYPDVGWVGRLKDIFEPLGEHHVVFNLGIPGDFSTELLKRFDIEASSRARYLWPNDEYMIILGIGINDSKGIGKPENTLTSPSQFKMNLKKLVKKAKNYSNEVVLLGLTPVDEKLVFPYEDTYFFNKKIREYNEIIKGICKKEKLLYIDLYDPLMKKDYKKLLSDGLHPNLGGYEAIFSIIKEKLKYWLN